MTDDVAGLLQDVFGAEFSPEQMQRAQGLPFSARVSFLFSTLRKDLVKVTHPEFRTADTTSLVVVNKKEGKIAIRDVTNAEVRCPSIHVNKNNTYLYIWTVGPLEYDWHTLESTGVGSNPCSCVDTYLLE